MYLGYPSSLPVSLLRQATYRNRSASSAVRVNRTLTKTSLVHRETQPIPPQDMEHRQLVILSLSEYLARTMSAFTKLQNERVRLAAEKQRIASHQTLHRKTNIKEQQVRKHSTCYQRLGLMRASVEAQHMHRASAWKVSHNVLVATGGH